MLRRQLALIIAIVLPGCAEIAGPAGEATKKLSPPSFLISDAPRAGNPQFYWLPPLVPAPEFFGTFDHTRAPIVRVCEWTNESCAAVIGLFTGGQVQVDITGQYYETIWRFKDSQLDSNRSYRLEVFDGTILLGYADLALVGKGKEKKSVDATQFVVLPTSGTLRIRFRIETSTENQPPVISAPASVSTDEDVAVTFTGTLAISDLDGTTHDLTLEAANGAITLSATAGLNFIAGDGIDDGFIRFEGSMASINAALNGLSVRPDLDFNGSAQLAILVNDGNLTDEAAVSIEVTAVNDPPLIASRDETLNLTTNSVRTVKFSVSDVDAGSASQIEVTISVDMNATLDLPITTGLTFFVGDGHDDTNMVFRGSLAAVNNALNSVTAGVVQTPQALFIGIVTLTAEVNDLGNSGAGGAQSTTRTWLTNYANAF